MGNALLNFSISFSDTHCCKCQARFAIPTEAYDKLRKSHASHWCPLCGQQQHFTAKSDEEKLRDELEAEKRRKENILAEANRLREKNSGLNLRLKAQRGATTRLRNRFKNGVCPCCTRSFTNLRDHMKTKHPDYVAESAP